MRFPYVLLSATALWAQPGPQAPPPPLVPQLTQAARMINDYADQRMFSADNARTLPPAAGEERVVFMGDSITIGWGRTGSPNFFPGRPYINRGISGQVTSQMLLRFYPDVILLKPKAVVILAGTNDIGNNIGPVPDESIQNNLAAMADMAKANGIKVIFSSVTPVCDVPNRAPQTQLRPPERINTLNRFLKEYAAKNGLIYLDYFSAMSNEKGLLKPELTADGLHFNAGGYAIMAPLAEKAISQALHN